MAVGDIINDVQSVLAAANLDFQPAAGVEIILTAFIGDISASADLILFDGTNEGILMDGVGTHGSPAAIKMGITNTNRLRIANTGGGTLVLGFTGIQIGA